jgi:hypothetical protein
MLEDFYGKKRMPGSEDGDRGDEESEGTSGSHEVGTVATPDRFRADFTR